jgi:hypothetical protein
VASEYHFAALKAKNNFFKKKLNIRFIRHIVITTEKNNVILLFEYPWFCLKTQAEGISNFREKFKKVLTLRTLKLMQLANQTLLLFLLNFFDAIFTIYWVRNGFASEGNHLMATLLDMGDLPFLAVKIAMGLTAAVVLWRWSDFKLARLGLGLALALYIGLMGIHFVTGLSAFGYISGAFVNDVAIWSNNLFC